VDAVGRWRIGSLHIEIFREPVRCTVYLPDIGGLLPVYVADRYAGFAAKPFPDLTDAEIERYITANGSAVREVVAAVQPDAALANHLVMGPVILARALDGQVRYAVKIHGSALEYTVRPHVGRFGRYAREGLQAAGGVLVGSRHTAESLWEVVDMPDLPARTRLLPPGVDTRRFHPRPVGEATARLAKLAERLEADPPAWGGDPGAAQALLAADPARDRIVSYVGKLIVSKGVDLLIGAWPLVVHEIPAARLIVAGFGAYRPGLMDLTRYWAVVTWPPPATSPGGAGNSRAARQGNCISWPRSWTASTVPCGSGTWLPRPRPCTGCTSPGGSSTTTCPS